MCPASGTDRKLGRVSHKGPCTKRFAVAARRGVVYLIWSPRPYDSGSVRVSASKIFVWYVLSSYGPPAFMETVRLIEVLDIERREIFSVILAPQLPLHFRSNLSYRSPTFTWPHQINELTTSIHIPNSEKNIPTHPPLLLLLLPPSDLIFPQSPDLLQYGNRLLFFRFHDYGSLLHVRLMMLRFHEFRLGGERQCRLKVPRDL